MTDTDKIFETLRLGRQLLNEFGLEDWKFDLSNHKRRVGQCDLDKKEIVFSVHYLESSMEEIEDTIRHEIAHALVGPNHGHDDTWRMMCLRVGAKPERLAGEEAVSTTKPNYIVECKGCGQRWERYRLRRKTYATAVSVCCQTGFNFYKVK